MSPLLDFQRDSLDPKGIRLIFYMFELFHRDCISLRIATAFDHVRMSSTDYLSISIKLLKIPMNPLR